MIHSKQELWALLQGEIERLGYQLFDIEMPCSKKGVVRIFISALARQGLEDSQSEQASQAGISIDDCVSVARHLNTMGAFEDLREKYSMEVSSPGINRKLRSLEHFIGAVGERIKITYFSDEDLDASKTDTVRAQLAAVEGDELSLLVEPQAEKRVIKFDHVHKAQVDFMFDGVK